MSEPDEKHVARVAGCIWTASRADEGTISATGANKIAHALLTSTDPAVLDAMQDALVRAGRLREERNVETIHDGFMRVIRTDVAARYVTDWREVEP